MKIIGKTNGGFILEASEEDIAGLQGLYKFENQMKIGSEIDIAGLFNKYLHVSIALNDVAKLSHTIELLSNAVDWVKQFRGENEE